MYNHVLQFRRNVEILYQSIQFSKVDFQLSEGMFGNPLKRGFVVIFGGISATPGKWQGGVSCLSFNISIVRPPSSDLDNASDGGIADEQ